MKICISMSPNGRRCQLDTGHDGPHRCRFEDSMEEWGGFKHEKPPNAQDILNKLEKQLARDREQRDFLSERVTTITRQIKAIRQSIGE